MSVFIGVFILVLGIVFVIYVLSKNKEDQKQLDRDLVAIKLAHEEKSQELLDLEARYIYLQQEYKYVQKKLIEQEQENRKMKEKIQELLDKVTHMTKVNYEI